MDLKQFNPDQWWKVLPIAGGLMTIAAIPVQFVTGILIGLGFLLFGVGEWINRPVSSGFIAGHRATGFSRSNKWYGLIIDLVGVGIFAFGFRKLVKLALA